jgi:hypothetical protein
MLISSNGGCPDGEVIAGTGTTVACGISVTGNLDEDVRSHLSKFESEQVAALLLLQPGRELGRDCLRSAGDAVFTGCKRLDPTFRQTVGSDESYSLLLRSACRSLLHWSPTERCLPRDTSHGRPAAWLYPIVRSCWLGTCRGFADSAYYLLKG